MATITWPTELPQYFLVDSYTEGFPDNLVRDNFDIGPAGVRPRTTAAPYRIQGRMILTTAEWDTFKAFHADVLLQGALPFGMPEQGVCDTDSPFAEWLVRLAEAPTRTAKGDGQWEVSMVLEVLPT